MTNLQSRQQLIEQFQEGIRAIGRKLWSGVGHTLAKCTLHPGQARLLYLMHQQGTTTTKVLATVLGTTPSAATQLVESLVQLGLVARKADTRDRRVAWLTLSPKGRKTFATFHRAHLRRLAKLLQPLTNAELAQFTSLQRKLL
ncbi:MAG: MarR family transcriptional regulator [Patescibacteria group bacterium]|jgi:DNA-binding MarR family transcriptional regulator